MDDKPKIKPRAWLQEPKVQRHAGKHLIRGVHSIEPSEEHRQFAELDGDVLIPLYEQAALNAAVLSERERCATIALNTASHCEDHENHYGASAAKDVADRIRDA